VSTETETERESTLAMALRMLQSLEALEGEHALWRGGSSGSGHSGAAVGSDRARGG
jgi:hypothetical protein